MMQCHLLCGFVVVFVCFLSRPEIVKLLYGCAVLYHFNICISEKVLQMLVSQQCLDLKIKIVKTGSQPKGVHCETGFLVRFNSNVTLSTKLLIVIQPSCAVDLDFLNSSFIKMKFWTCSEVANSPGLNKHSNS